MADRSLETINKDNRLLLNFSGELSLYTIPAIEKEFQELATDSAEHIELNLERVSFIDTAASIYINNLQTQYKQKNIRTTIVTNNKEIDDTLQLVKKRKTKESVLSEQKSAFFETLGIWAYEHFSSMLRFMAFLGRLFFTIVQYIRSIQNIRYKEIAFEINESAVKALPIITLTSFLIGLIVAYQSAYQLKIYGANIYLVDMLGISMLRELAPLITAIIIAGRSGSAFTAQIGAMKITQELDAMRTMGFDPFAFLFLPRIIALIIAMPIMIFVSDIMGVLGGMLIANIDLDISVNLFIDRFSYAVAAKHFFIGIFKGPFFAFLIASIGIYRGMKVKDDTQSIGFNTTKSVVEAIFAVIICDAVFSIAFTHLGI